jgi:phosphoglycerate dehydrogenase-like enzyme
VHGAPVSEAALTGMLALSRDMPRFARNQDTRTWGRWPAKLLHDKTVGILGMGVIAEALAPKCKAFGMKVVGLTSVKRDVPGFDSVHDMDEMHDVLPHLDYLVLLTPYSAATHHMIDARVFAAMKPTSYLINVARGGVVDEDAMVVALREKQIAGAALDVFEQEPLPPDHPLWTTPNVLITPHTAGHGPYLDDRRGEILLDNCRRFLANQPLRNVVDKSRWF